jgi:hypothetical protein
MRHCIRLNYCQQRSIALNSQCQISTENTASSPTIKPILRTSTQYRASNTHLAASRALMTYHTALKMKGVLIMKHFRINSAR